METIVKIGILGAMLEEVNAITESMTILKITNIAGRDYYEGYFNDIHVIVVFSRWGKVASAITTTTLINIFKTDFIIFTGVAGAINESLNIGDIVIGNGLYQHDMDARPFFDQFQIPLTNTSIFKPQMCNIKKAEESIKFFIKNIYQYVDRSVLNKFLIFDAPKLYLGLIASGDKFISDSQYVLAENTFVVEMEGASVAQVCEDHKIPYLIVRIVSDKADHSATIDFQKFTNFVASRFSYGIINEYLKLHSAAKI